jgi:hypothetical protein
LKELGIEGVTDDDIWLVWDRYDTDKDGTIKFSEFANMLSPVTIEYANHMASRKPEIGDLTKPFEEWMFAFHAKLKFKECLQQLIDTQKTI